MPTPRLSYLILRFLGRAITRPRPRPLPRQRRE
nr:MAG TPA: hypothetical protein [Caudoviricetes sp.]